MSNLSLGQVTPSDFSFLCNVGDRPLAFVMAHEETVAHAELVAWQVALLSDLYSSLQLTEETGAAGILAMPVRRPWHTKARPCAQCGMLDPWLKCPVRLGFET